MLSFKHALTMTYFKHISEPFLISAEVNRDKINKSDQSVTVQGMKPNVLLQFHSLSLLCTLPSNLTRFSVQQPFLFYFRYQWAQVAVQSGVRGWDRTVTLHWLWIVNKSLHTHFDCHTGCLIVLCFFSLSVLRYLFQFWFSIVSNSLGKSPHSLICLAHPSVKTRFIYN